MNNVIPLKRSEHVISDAELDKLANALLLSPRAMQALCHSLQLSAKPLATH